MHKRSGHSRAGFTLIEIMLAIALLVVLSTVAIVGITGIKSGADKDTATLLVNQTVDAIKLFNVHMNVYPDTDEGLQALVTRPTDAKVAEKWRGPYLADGKIPVDPWGNELKYEKFDLTGAAATGPAFRVFSYGPDAQEGTDDDISSVKDTAGA
jgi:general secretion pathway protein G